MIGEALWNNLYSLVTFEAGVTTTFFFGMFLWQVFSRLYGAFSGVNRLGPLRTLFTFLTTILIGEARHPPRYPA